MTTPLAPPMTGSLPGAAVLPPGTRDPGASVLELTSQIDSLVMTYLADSPGSAASSTNPTSGTAPSLGEFLPARVVLVGGDDSHVPIVAKHLRQAGFGNCIVVASGGEASQAMRQERPDIVLLAAQLSDGSGLALLKQLRGDANLASIPVIVLYRSSDTPLKTRALEAGACDFLATPPEASEVITRVRNVLELKKHRDFMAGEVTRLEQLVSRRTTELEKTRQHLILSLARAAEHRDEITGNHVIRVGRYAGVIARELGWTASRIEMLEQAAQLHDVGKIGVPDAILFKPGKLDPSEFDVIKKHCAWGKGILEPYSDSEIQSLRSHTRLGEAILYSRTSPMLVMASRIAQTHHENWDGTGYPLGLAGEDIPLEGRITAVADMYDALSSKRPYKDPFPREKCFEIMREQRGRKFDPQVLDAFFARASRIIQIQIELMDNEVMDRSPARADTKHSPGT